MATKADVIEDSISSEGIRLVTVQYRCPRSILAELNTHRVISKSARSSRAVPTAKLLEEVANDPYIPAWTVNKPGMQGDPADPETAQHLTEAWLRTRDRVLADVAYMLQLGSPHKSDVNRLLESWMWVDGVITSTDWANFFALRIHPAAHPAMRELAEVIKQAMDYGIPVSMGANHEDSSNWHLPYITAQDRASLPLEQLRLISAARCGRVSYRPHDGSDVDVERDLKRGMEMMVARPLHASPFEHVAVPDHLWANSYWAHPAEHRNFRGWRQFRAMLAGETVRDEK